ncbi:hypothetical protein ACIRRA_18620 [Nocardia sp. NPDC101769]|uniref:hypothetical protein n=1 Tax=Nocardia sp. NPDC101769 TaxID=3364333 RepID=UPI0038025299
MTATAVPLTAALLAIHPKVAAADPGLTGLPPIGEIISGSAAPDSGAAAVDAPTGSALGLGTGNGYTGSQGAAGQGGATSGSSAGVAQSPVVGVPLGTGASGSADLPGGTEPRAADLAIPGPAAPSPAAAPNTLGGLVGLNSGSVLTACAGSAVVGSAALGLGILTGSGMGSGLIGPGFVPGSSGLVGPGSAGTGSVAVGSAATGSALLTCMLMLPVPTAPGPGIPLQIPPAPAVVPAAAPIPVPAPAAIPPAPVPVPPLSPPPPPVEYAAPVPSEQRPPLTALQVMTVMIITIIAGARARLARAHRGAVD